MPIYDPDFLGQIKFRHKYTPHIATTPGRGPGKLTRKAKINKLKKSLVRRIKHLLGLKIQKCVFNEVECCKCRICYREDGQRRG